MQFSGVPVPERSSLEAKLHFRAVFALLVTCLQKLDHQFRLYLSMIILFESFRCIPVKQLYTRNDICLFRADFVVDARFAITYIMH